MYKQCEIVKAGFLDTCWIPVEHAKQGKYIKLKNEDGTWDDGWQVREVYSTTRAIEEIRALQSEDRSYKDSSIGWDDCPVVV